MKKCGNCAAQEYGGKRAGQQIRKQMRQNVCGNRAEMSGKF